MSLGDQHSLNINPNALVSNNVYNNTTNSQGGGLQDNDGAVGSSLQGNNDYMLSMQQTQLYNQQRMRYI